MIRRLVIAVATLGLTGSLAGWSHAVEIVAPNELASVEGNANNTYPFGTAGFGINSMRYQQVYAASQFAALSTPQLVTAIFFRPDLTGFGSSAFTSTLANVRIDLSTTLANPDALSANFASNVGVNNTTVYSGSLTLSSASTGPAAGPKDFDIVIRLMTPFLYDPTLGNLLLDVRNFSGGTTHSFDAQNTQGDSVSRVYSNSANGVNDASGSTDTYGLVTKFEFGPTTNATAVPEPSTFAGAGVGIAFAVGAYLRRRRPRG